MPKLNLAWIIGVLVLACAGLWALSQGDSHQQKAAQQHDNRQSPMDAPKWYAQQTKKTLIQKTASSQGVSKTTVQTTTTRSAQAHNNPAHPMETVSSSTTTHSRSVSVRGYW